MQRRATSSDPVDSATHAATLILMPREVEGIIYYTMNEVAEMAGVSRQTLWRWIKDEKVPDGMRFRSGEKLFDDRLVEQIRGHANHLEPASEPNRNQLSLFNGAKQGD